MDDLKARLNRRGNRYDDGVMMDGELINPDGPEAATRLAEVEAERDGLRAALTPSGDTKAAYMGEFSFTIMQAQEDEDGEAIECPIQVYVPWTTIKEIMAAILARQALGAKP